jgi:hypothetical protein
MRELDAGWAVVIAASIAALAAIIQNLLLVTLHKRNAMKLEVIEKKQEVAVSSLQNVEEVQGDMRDDQKQRLRGIHDLVNSQRTQMVERIAELLERVDRLEKQLIKLGATPHE